jgi:hypothetical protein
MTLIREGKFICKPENRGMETKGRALFDPALPL